MRLWQGLVFVPLTAGVMISAAYAQQSPADDFARRQAAQQSQQKIEALRALTPNENNETEPSWLEGQNIIPSDGQCFTVERIVVEGAYKISARTVAGIASHYNGKCVGLADIQAVMKALTNAYLAKGYVAARLYIPEQDMKSSRVLKLVVMEGALSDIYYNGKSVSIYDGVMLSAFPGLKGRTLNMRDIEQGLDQINRLASNNAKSEMLPGGEDGGTIVNVVNLPDKRWQAFVSHDNLGQASTGYARYNAGLTLNNVLRVNDLWNFSYQRTDKDYWRGSRLDGDSNSISGSVSIPHGYWTFNVSGYYYEYKSLVAGNFGPIKTSGDSSELRGSVSRLLHRDGKSLTTLNFGLAYKETNNFLLGSKIEVGSRNYTVANLGLSHSRQMLAGTWTFDVNYLQGLGLFGAVKKDEAGAGDAEPEFSKFTAAISAMTPFRIREQNFVLSNLLSGQYSPDSLFGAEQMSLGSSSNVRGARDSLLFGNNGFFIRNELAWRTVPWGRNAALVKALGELRPYAGLDYGQIFAQARYGFEDDNLAGWTVGAKLAGGGLSLDAGYSEIFSSTVKRDGSGLAFISMTVSF
ncbi:MAG: Hemolysin secretion/activation protein [Candidatus Tokpelaia hoelldobleri]|uniref:Hemolysin secretion/activation protein n=1 Tax=Candidatus Tokpelaia hoelldobleri TaxID=1902579 RepID=A0A1U9JWW9_9HYPH|nr:MAG: Hemolysin secretion/activation protein [Candidatus Tokpelaia hoelldoblerii]